MTILIGGNDAQSFEVNNESVEFESAAMAHHLFPTCRPHDERDLEGWGQDALGRAADHARTPSSAASMQTLNAIYKAQAALHPGVEFLPTWALFSNAEGQYSA